MDDEVNASDQDLRERIVSAAVDQVRRFGDAKTNVVDIARALGTSHTTLYRHFRSKTAIFDAIVQDAMNDEASVAAAYVRAEGPASQRLEGMVLALQARKRARLTGDPEIYALYRRVMEERQDMIARYAAAMTELIREILDQGVNRGEFQIDDIAQAAGVVRDSVTVFVHPMHVEAGLRAGQPIEDMARAVVRTLVRAFRVEGGSTTQRDP